MLRFIINYLKSFELYSQEQISNKALLIIVYKK